MGQLKTLIDAGQYGALEVLADIARTIGEQRLCTPDVDTRENFEDFVKWADEFQAIYEANPDACDTYYEDVEAYAIKRALESGYVKAKPEGTVIMAYTKKRKGRMVDRWCAYETYEEANTDFINLCEDEDTYTASLCMVVESSDYSFG